jgi:hypothetical protein
MPDIPIGKWGNGMLDRTDTLARAAEYRQNAEACEKLARTAIYPDIGRQLRDIARQWRLLADRVESIACSPILDRGNYDDAKDL